MSPALRAELLSEFATQDASQFVPRLEERIRSTIGGHGWTLEIDPNAPDGGTVDFKYPAGIPGAHSPCVAVSTVLLRSLVDLRRSLGDCHDKIPSLRTGGLPALWGRNVNISFQQLTRKIRLDKRNESC
jgi:hypothetical protein